MQVIDLRNPFYPHLAPLEKISDDEMISLFQNRVFRSHAYFSPYNFLRKHIKVLNTWIEHFLNFIHVKRTKINCHNDEPTRCGITSQAILELNPIKQKF